MSHSLSFNWNHWSLSSFKVFLSTLLHLIGLAKISKDSLQRPAGVSSEIQKLQFYAFTIFWDGKMVRIEKCKGCAFYSFLKMWTENLKITQWNCSVFYLGPSPIIALPCHSVIVLSFAQIVGFVKLVILISPSCYMDLSMLIHGFLWVVTWICQNW